MLGILGPVIQREGLTTCSWKFLEPGDDRVIRFSSSFSGHPRDQHKRALAFGQCV
jgi:hypothetical protein